jgi:YegS/Rv2252/BmrU family lipid kinase
MTPCPENAAPRRRIRLIINPKSGKGKTARKTDRVFRELSRLGVEFQPFFTEGPGHAVELVRSLDGEAAAVIGLGGDGTINEIVNGAAGKDIAVGLIPSGTGNDFARLMGLRSIDDGISAVAAGDEKILDRINLEIQCAGGTTLRRYCINTMGVGFDAAVAFRVATYDRGSGILPYLAAVYRTLWSFETAKSRVAWDGGGADTGLFLATIGNGTTSGGGFVLSPHAVPDDGLLDLCLVREVSKTRVITILPKTFKGRHLSAPEVRYARSPRFTIELERPLPAHADGELLTAEALLISASVETRTVRVITRSGADRER